MKHEENIEPRGKIISTTLSGVLVFHYGVPQLEILPTTPGEHTEYLYPIGSLIPYQGRNIRITIQDVDEFPHPITDDESLWAAEWKQEDEITEMYEQLKKGECYSSVFSLCCFILLLYRLLF